MGDAATLPTLLRQLRLPTMATCCDDITERALAGGWPILQTLATLCQHELPEREQGRLQRYTREAWLPAGKTLAAFDFSGVESSKHQQLIALACDTTWVEQTRNLLLFCAFGLGKGHIAAAIGDALIELDLSVRYYSASALVQEVQTAKQGLRLVEVLNKLDNCSPLILDNIGYVKRR